MKCIQTNKAWKLGGKKASLHLVHVNPIPDYTNEEAHSK